MIYGIKPGGRLSDLQPFWQRLRTRARLKDARIHDLRHTFASAAVAAGQALSMIGKLLGHTHVQTTARYTHLAADPVKAAADHIPGVIPRAVLGEKSGRAVSTGDASPLDERRALSERTNRVFDRHAPVAHFFPTPLVA